MVQILIGRKYLLGGHTLALKNNGTLWSSGANGNGQAGIGSISDINTFVQVGTDIWTKISAGFQFSIGLKTDGTIWSWGFNGNGQLGINGTADVNVPTQIGSLSGWTSITAGSSFVFAINEQNDLFGWGYNGFGNLGITNPNQINTPMFIESDAMIIAASDGFFSNNSIYGYHSMLIKNTNQKIICTAGTNYVSQLGNGLTSTLDFFDCNTGNINDASIFEISNININFKPNPFSDLLTVDLSKINEKTSLKITTIDGKKVHETQLEANSVYVWNTVLEAQVFIYHLTGKEGKTVTGKLVKL